MNTSILSQSAPVQQLSSAFRLGLQDAASRLPFAPEMYFTGRMEKVQYAVAFELIRGANEVTRQFTHAA